MWNYPRTRRLISLFYYSIPKQKRCRSSLLWSLCRHHCSASYHNIHFCLHCAVMTLWAYQVTFTANAPQNPSTTTSFKSHFDFERNPICRLTSIVGEKMLHDANVIYFVVVGKKLCIQAPAISEKGIGNEKFRLHSHLPEFRHNRYSSLPISDELVRWTYGFLKSY